MDPSSSPFCALDASVLVNLVATGHAEALMRALGTRCVATEHVHREITRPHPGSAAQVAHVERLLASGALHIAPLPPSAADLYIDLVAAPRPDGLDDGEAATIALAVHGDGACYIDEAKGRRILRTLRPSMVCGSSVTLIRRAIDVGGDTIAPREILLGALIGARMRVLDEDLAWVRSHLTPDDIQRCRSLRRSVRGG